MQTQVFMANEIPFWVRAFVLCERTT
jgi:hypothetical protein